MPLLKKINSDLLVEYNFSELEGCRMAVDVSIFLNKYIRSSGERLWLNSFILLLCTLRKYKIKCVMIFDGPEPPIEKKEEQQRRREQVAKSRKRLENAISMKERLEELNTDELSEEIVSECVKILGKNYDYLDEFSSKSYIIKSLLEVIDKLERQTIAITSEHRETAEKLVKLFGLKCIRASGEAETLCSYLALKGTVDSVLTEDTDVLAYGCPLMFCFRDFKLEERKLIGLQYKHILNELELTHKQFKDLCILLSCDYNDRAKGFMPGSKKPVCIGPARALELIKTYGDLDEIYKYLINPEVLNYKRCRELFTVPTVVNDDLVPFLKEPNYKRIEKFIRRNNLHVNIDYIKNCHTTSSVVIVDE